MPRVTVHTLAGLLRELQPHLGQTQFPHALYQSLRKHVDRRVAVAFGELHFPDQLPGGRPALVEGEVRVWWAANHPEALADLVGTLVRVHQTITELRTEMLAMEEQSTRSARMIGILAHEIKNPLFAILGSLELVRAEELDENIRKLIEAAYTSAQRMHTLVNDSLKLISVEQEGVRLKAERCSVNDLLSEITREAEPVAAASQVHLRVIPIPGDAELLADKGWLQQAVLNVVLNAVKFTPAGGRVQIKAQRTPGAVRFIVSDTGPGIPKEQIERIFEPFQRGDTKKEGSGLGLTIVKRVVEAHGGEVSVDSRPGRGSTFTITLPRLVGARGGGALALRVLVLTALLGLVVTRLPIYPVPLEVQTPQGARPLPGGATLARGGTVRLGDAVLRFDPGSRLRLSAKRSLWGNDLRSSLRLEQGGVNVVRNGPRPALKVALNYASLTPRGTKFYAASGTSDRVSLFDGKLDLRAPGYSGSLGPGEGVAISSAGVSKSKLPAAPQVRAATTGGRLVLRWLPVAGAVSYRVEMLAGGVLVGQWQTKETSWSYEPRQDRRVVVRVRAVGDLDLLGPASAPQTFLENASLYQGHQLFSQGEYQEAARLLKKATSFAPTNPRAWLELGLSLLKSGDVTGGKEALERALELEPDYQKQVALPLAEALERSGDLRDALRYYVIAREVSPRAALLGEARVSLGLNDAAAAEQSACAWLREHLDDVEAAALLRRALEAQNKRSAGPGCPLSLEAPEPAPRPAPKPKKEPEPKPKPAPKPQPKPQPKPKRSPPDQVCNPFCK